MASNVFLVNFMHKLLRAFLPLGLLFCFSFSARAAFVSPSLEFYTVKTDHFYIHYPKEASLVAKDTAEIAENVYAKLTPKFDWKPWGRTHIVLLDKTDESNGLATVIPANYLLLYITPPMADSSLDNYKNYLELLITHEFTHILHIDQYHKVAEPFHWVFGKIVAPNGLTPGWMREGLATWQETAQTGRGRGNSSYTDMVLRTSLYENDFPAIDEAAGLANTWPGSHSQYLFGVRFWQWLNTKYGEEAIVNYMKEYSSGLWLFSLNNKAKRVFGKTFYQLWKEWRADLATEYAELKDRLALKGLTEFQKLVDGKNQQTYLTPNPQGIGYAYVETSLDERAQIIMTGKTGEKPTFIKKSVFGQMSFSHDGQTLAFGSLSGIQPYTTYSDIYLYDRTKKKLSRVFEKGKPKISLRASDPDFSPADGGKRWIVMVRTNLGTDNLYVYDLTNKKGYFLTEASKYTQFSNPRFSPDGEKIVASRHDHEGNRDIVLYDKKGNEIKKITDDEANDNTPVWSPQGNAIYYESDKSGIFNIFRHDLANGEETQITNVLTGVTHPSISPDGEKLYATYYTSHGFDLKTLPLAKEKSVVLELRNNYASLLQDKNKDKKPPVIDVPPLSGALAGALAGAKKYSALPQIFVPRYLVPTFATLDSAYLLGFSTGRYDPLYRHNWSLYANYRSDAQFVGGGGLYIYSRYRPTFFTGFARYALNWGDIFGTGTDFFEQRLQGFTGASMAFPHQQVALSYFFENRDNLTAIPSGSALANLDHYAGVHAQYWYYRYQQFPNSISQEKGPFVKLNFDVTDALLGAADDNEQRIFVGDARYYFEMPWGNHQVLGLRTAGGYAWGDSQFAGSFRLGGPFGEGVLAGYSARLFPLRGLPGIAFPGDRALLFSAEYRLPLTLVERGIGTLPLFLKEIHMAFFGDYGNTWFGNDNGRDLFENFLLGVGTEIRGNFVVGYGLPVTARLGYALIVVNRDRIDGLSDSLLGLDATNGTFYLQFGTSF